MGEVSASSSLGSAAPAPMGKYSTLGSGGMADVFLAMARGPQRVDKLVVIKRLRDPDDEELIPMFLDEARFAARLSHPNIVHTYEVAEANGEFHRDGISRGAAAQRRDETARGAPRR